MDESKLAALAPANAVKTMHSNSGLAVEMTCPRCDMPQPAGPECRYCGVIISKARKPPLTAGPTQHPNLTRPETRMPPRPFQSGFSSDARRHLQRIWTVWIGSPLHPGIQRWSQRMGDALVRCAVVFSAAFILEAGLLYLAKALWYVYTSTLVGERFLLKFGTQAEAINIIVNDNPLLLAWDVTLTALFVCLFIGVVARFFLLLRFFYEPFGALGRLIFWGLPLTALTGWAMNAGEGMSPFALIYILVAVPTLCLMNSCLYIVRAGIPELGMLIMTAKKGSTDWVRRAGRFRSKIHQWFFQKNH